MFDRVFGRRVGSNTLTYGMLKQIMKENHITDDTPITSSYGLSVEKLTTEDVHIHKRSIQIG